MKKAVNYFLSFSTAALILVLTTSQVKAPAPPKELTVTLTIQGWNVVLDCIDKSNASHLQVMDARETIVNQLNKQLQPDSTQKK